MPILDDDIAHAALRAADSDPERPFLILRRETGIETLRYGELLRRSASYKSWYGARGIVPGSIVSLVLVTHRDLAPAFLGALMAGLTPTLFPPRTPHQDPTTFWQAHAAVFKRLQAEILLTESAQTADARAHLPELGHRIVDIDREGPCEAIEYDGTITANPTGVAFLQHSSGTTGLKKGVMLTHRAVLEFVAAMAHALAIGDDDVIASWLPLYHDMGLVGCLVLPMVLGLTVVQMDPFEWVGNPSLLLDAIEQHGATLCWMPNFAFHHILRSVPEGRNWDLTSMRALIDCSEPCKAETLRQFHSRFAASGLRATALQVSYGFAENVFIVTQTDSRAEPRTILADRTRFETAGLVIPPRAAAEIEFLSVGRTIPGTLLRIEDPEGQALPDRRVGEVVVASPYLFSGYFRAAMPDGKLCDGWYRSGDLGFTDQGELFICGRTDDLLIVHGKNIFAHDVEFSVNRHDMVRPGRVVAIAPHSARLGSSCLIVIAEMNETSETARVSLRRQIKRAVESEFDVALYDVLVAAPGWLMKTTSGKISRNANERKYLALHPVA